MTTPAPEQDAAQRAARIAQQNDRFRSTWGADFTIPGQIVITPGVGEKDIGFQAEMMTAVMQFDDFSEDNNPHGERDFGAFDVQGERLFWKLDLYDVDYRYGTPEPTNPSVTRRVLTIMLACEY